MNVSQGPSDETKYKVELQPAEGAVQVSDGTVNVLVSLTSAVMREPAGEPRPHASVPAMFDTPTSDLYHRPILYL